MTRLSTVVIEVVSLALGLFCFREGALSNSYLHRLFCRRSDVKTSQENEDILVWAPNENLSDSKLDEYIAVAKEKHGYNMEQALGMLFWHDHDIEEAMMDLPNFTPLRDEWSDVDKILFENGITWHGKNFQRIHQMLPNKTFASIIKYYYEWKMSRPKSKGKARQARKQKRKQEGSGGKVGGDLNVPNPANPEIEPRKKKQKKK